MGIGTWEQHQIAFGGGEAGVDDDPARGDRGTEHHPLGNARDAPLRREVAGVAGLVGRCWQGLGFGSVP